MGWKQQAAAVVCKLDYFYSLSTTETRITTYHFIFQWHIAATRIGTITSSNTKYSMFAVEEKYFKILFLTSHMLKSM